MKTRIGFIVFFLIISKSFCQDREASPMKFIWSNFSQPTPLTIDSFPQKNFVNGFQWAGTPNMNHALLNNAGASDYPYWEDGTVYHSKIYDIHQPTYLMLDSSNTGYTPGIWNAPAMVYEPTLLIPYGYNGSFILRQYDSSNAIFGFKHIVGQILPANQHTNENYNRLILRKGIDTGLVLNDIWPKPTFVTYNGNGQSGGYQGQKWNLTINLRRLDISQDDTLDDKVILEIKIPFKSNWGSLHYYASIKFDSIPYPTIADTMRICYPRMNNFMGYEIKRQGIPNILHDSILRINRSMLPIDPNKKDITISAHFQTYSDGLEIIHNDNPAFIGNNDPLNPQIDSIDIEVVNHGITGICIDYIKIESEEAYYISRGAMDSLGTLAYLAPASFGIIPFANDTNSSHAVAYNSIKDVIQSRLLRTKRYNLNGVLTNPFHRIYAQEYESDDPIHWWQLRYFNLVTNGLAITRDASKYPELYEYYTRSPARFIGIGYSSFDVQLPAPYSRKGLEGNWKGYGLKRGFWGDLCNPNDTLTSGYETQFPYCDEWKIDGSDSAVNNDSYYWGRMSQGPFIQETIEKNFIYPIFYQPSVRNYWLFYSDKPWWGYLDLENISLDTAFITPQMKNVTYRIKTGEEERLLINETIAMGGKGLFYDGDHNLKLPNTANGVIGIGDGNKLDLTHDIYSDDVGTDFIDPVHNTWNAYQYSNLDTLSLYLNVSKERIYIGTKSIRAEFYKIHSWIRAVEREKQADTSKSDLMDLRLCAWYGKGFRIYSHQDSSRFGSENIMNKFIIPSGILTRPIGRTKNNLPYYEQETPIDSGFYDISLMRDRRKNIDSTFYIAIVSRRTSPLICTNDTAYNSNGTRIIDSSVKFYTDAEFDKFIEVGGRTTVKVDTGYYWRSASYWRNLWWKRHGAREVTIPFLVNDTNYYKYQYPLLRITELGGEDSAFNAQTWRQSQYYSKVDTIIGFDGKLIVKLLPGDGKILKITVLRSNNIYGNLAHSNQSKLISNPILTPTGIETDSMRFHLVYFKPLSNREPHMYDNGVYYRRSLPIKKNSMNSNIIWEPEICVSDRIFDNVHHEPEPYDSISCDYPSIVVRTDGNVLKAYIVYSCEGHAQYNQIVETILNVNGATVNDNDGQTLCQYSGIDRSEFGNPVVSAVSNGNIYAWSDSTDGIIAGWKSPSATNFTFNTTYKDTNRIHFKINGLENRYFAKHPSLNVYSHYSESYLEDNCALVWQEPYLYGPTYDESNIQIFYTRLKDSLLHFKHYIPPYATVPVLDAPKRNAANNIALMSDTLNSSQYGSNLNKFPVVHRNLDNYGSIARPGSGSGTAPNRIDRIYWESYGFSFPYTYSYIAQRPIDLYDSLNISLAWNVYAKSRITSGSSVLLTQPVITQGYSKSNYNQYGKGLLLDFLYVDQRYYGAGIWEKLYQLPHSLSSFVVWSPLDVYLGGEEVEQYGLNTIWNHTFFQNHLSHHNKVWDSTFAWRNRRVFNVDDTIPYSIQTSARYFYKTNAEENKVEGIVGFSSGMSNYLIHTPILDGKTVGLYLPFVEVTDSLGNIQMVRSQNDTIFSDWFNVNDLSTFDFKCKGYDSSKVQISIQRESDGLIYPLTIPDETSDTLGKLCKYFLVNGNDNQYRLLFLNKNLSSSYSEEVWLGGLPVDTMLFANKASVNMGYDIIDLGGGVNKDISNNNMIISVHPNPANEVVYINGLLPASVYLENGNTSVNHKIKYQIYSQIGCVQMSVEGVPGETMTINTTNLPAGVYFIRAEHKSDNYYNPVSPVMGSFVISR